MTAIIGVDPGTTTGIFAANVSIVDTLRDRKVRTDYRAYELDASKAFAVMQLQLDRLRDPTVVCEHYIVTQRTARLTQQPTALEVIGALRQLCADRGVHFRLQMKSDAAHIAKNAVLKRIGWYQSGQDHANDAARHALLGLASVDPPAFNALLTFGSIVSTSR